MYGAATAGAFSAAQSAGMAGMAVGTKAALAAAAGGAAYRYQGKLQLRLNRLTLLKTTIVNDSSKSSVSRIVIFILNKQVETQVQTFSKYFF